MKKWYVISFVIACIVTYIIYQLTHVFFFLFPPLAVIFVQHYMRTKDKDEQKRGLDD
ncbi:hypothetical protein [Kurthia massiliensis]|uniref:hypothetical protein n=1 Tax=Kurthia massiliensis TaxID=1033739 RepID=UPI0002E5A1AD|nr:hypothetical protein [Kurthia massiliensis]